MTVVVIFEDDLDNKTVKQVDTTAGKKVGAPGAEIEVLDSHNRSDTETHYYVGETKYLKHVETGAVWAAEIGHMKERAAPRNEELTLDSQEGQFIVQSDVVTLNCQPVSAISGNHLSPVVKLCPQLSMKMLKRLTTRTNLQLTLTPTLSILQIM